MSNLGKLAENGLLGLLLVIALLAIAFLYREVRSLQEKRIQDLKEARDSLAEPMKAIKQTVDLILSQVNNNGK